eukprot:scaffold225204_cov18-Tisochrysis_lutea.AAC.1
MRRQKKPLEALLLGVQVNAIASKKTHGGREHITQQSQQPHLLLALHDHLRAYPHGPTME